MIEEQKKTQKGFQNYCGGLPCGDMMRKMMEAKKSDLPFNCEEMMSKMMQMFRGAGEKKERSPREPEESSAPKQ